MGWGGESASGGLVSFLIRSGVPCSPEGEAHGADLECAIEAVLERRPVPAEQHPSLGCNIKWRAGSAAG